MFYSKIPVISALENLGAVKFTAYKITSSIFEPVPSATFKFTTSYATPEILNLPIGSEFLVRYSFEDEVPEDGSDTYSDFPDLYLKKMKLKGSASGLEYEVQCRGILEFFQNAEFRKCYKNKYSNEILNDIFDSLQAFKDYERNFKKSSNSSTLYRTLGETDLDFIKLQVNNNFLIEGGKPLFFTGLDKKLNLSSINALLTDPKKSKCAILLSVVNDKLSPKFVADKIKSYVEDPDAENFSTPDFEMYLGNDRVLKGIKPETFFTRFDSDVSSTAGYSFLPIQKESEKSVFPISKMFVNGVNTTDAKTFFNRPAKNVIAESRNTFESFEDLIKFKIKLTSLGPMKKLLLAGDKVCIVTPYPYSAFNGDYLISAITYGAEKAAAFCELEVIRPNLDPSWSEKLEEQKDSEDFGFAYAPELNTSTLFSV